MKTKNENEIPFENELPEGFAKRLKFQMEYEKLCEWEIDKQEFKKYVLICEKLREFVKTYSGEVTVDYNTQLIGKDPSFRYNKTARCEIKILALGIVSAAVILVSNIKWLNIIVSIFIIFGIIFVISLLIFLVFRTLKDRKK